MRKMKNSGVAWIGDVPENWGTIPNKYLMRKVKAICQKYSNEDVLSLTMNGVIKRDLDNPSGKMPSTFDGYQFVYAGNLLMCLFDIDVTPRCIGLIENDGITSPAYSQFELKRNAFNRYYYYYYLYLDNKKELLHLAKNLRHSFTEEQFGQIPIVVPPIEQQHLIANQLDFVCKKVEDLISNQEQQIEKLKQYKQSLITEVVTKGLNPDVPMKDSGVKWIGQIPENWTIKPLKSLFGFGKGLPITKENLQTNGVPVISYGQIHAKWNSGVTIHNELKRFVSETYIKTNPNSLVKYGDFIFADTSEDRDGCGNCVYVDKNETLFAGYHTVILTSNSHNSNKYLAYLFLTDTWRSQIRCKVSGIKVFSISRKILSSTSIILPDIAEQNNIVSYLDNKCAKIDRLIAIKQEKINKLNDYKKSLIYEYVTGKKEA